MNWYVAGLAKHCAAYDQNSLVEVHIVPVQMSSLIHPHCSNCENAEESSVGGGPQSFRRRKLCRSAKPARDLFVAIDVGRLSLLSVRKKAGRWDLCPRFRRTVPCGEAPDHTETPSPRVRLSFRGLDRPAECQILCDVRGAFGLEKGDKVAQAARPFPEFKPKSAANRDVCIQRLIECVHRPPPTLGHR